MNKTRIEWCDYSWNPIKGICSVGCWYCYARRMYQRFKWDQKIRLDMSVPIELYGRLPDGSRIFVCSTFEIFHPAIPAHYRDYIFGEIQDYSNLTFIILTKMPELIDRPMPPNVWLGVSITEEDDVYDRYQGLIDAKAKLKFVSFEPLFKAVYLPIQINWAIIGRLTGHGHQHDPSPSLLKIMVKTFQRNKIPVFLKNNLKDIWKGPLIQEWPEEV